MGFYPRIYLKLLPYVLAGLLSACAPPPPPPPIAKAPQALPALNLLTIQENAYVQGFAAGKRSQARYDHALAAKASASSIAQAQAQTITPSIQPVAPAPPPILSPPPTANFVSAGPAQPLTSP